VSYVVQASQVREALAMQASAHEAELRHERAGVEAVRMRMARVAKVCMSVSALPVQYSASVRCQGLFAYVLLVQLCAVSFPTHQSIVFPVQGVSCFNTCAICMAHRTCTRRACATWPCWGRHLLPAPWWPPAVRRLMSASRCSHWQLPWVWRLQLRWTSWTC
jgi:hypothetical protein